MPVMEIKIDKLRQEIGRLGITLKEFADKCDVSRQTIYNYWQNPRDFSLKTLDKIARALDLDTKDLIK